MNGEIEGEKKDLAKQDDGDLPNGDMSEELAVAIRTDKIPWWTSCRFLISFICFLGTINLYVLRGNMSIAVVCMVNHTWVSEYETVSQQNNFTKVNVNSSRNNFSRSNGDSGLCGGGGSDEDGSFLWDEALQGHILGSLYYGYLVTQIPGGYISSVYGAKRVYGIAMFIAAIATLLTQAAAEIHVSLLILCRILVGLGSGVSFPAMHSLWGQWAPPKERSRLVTFSYGGSQVGTIVSMLVTAQICKYLGWIWIFYIYGGFGIIWCILWYFFVFDHPDLHPRISKVEKEYILWSLNKKSGSYKTIKASEVISALMKIPWWRFFISLPVLCIMFANFCSDWGAYTFLGLIPSYMKEVLKFCLSENGLYSTLPYICFWAIIVLGGTFADLIQTKKILSTVWTRKLMTNLGFIPPGIALIILAYVTSDTKEWGVVLLIIGVAMTGTQFSGMYTNHIDIAPKYAGILFGICNMWGAAAGFIALPLAGAIRKRKEYTPEENWRLILYITAGWYLAAGLFYLIFASGTLQSWAKEEDDDEEKVEEELQPMRNSVDHGEKA